MTRDELREALRACNDRDKLYALERANWVLINGDQTRGIKNDAELVAIVNDRSMSLDGP